MRLTQVINGLAIFLLTIITFQSCSSESVNLQQTDNIEIESKGKVESNQRHLIARIIEEEATETFNIKEYKDYIINHELLQEVENINIDYGFNPVEEKKDAFLTIIGFQDGFTIAYQAELIIEDDNIFIGDPEYEAYLFNKHTCAGDGCESCKFKRKWFWGKIRGCKCTDGGSGICNHSVSNEGGIFTKLINFFL